MSRTHLRYRAELRSAAPRCAPHSLIACLALACAALGAAFAFASFRVFRALHNVLEIFSSDPHVEIAARDWFTAACVVLALAAATLAAALAIAGRRAALVLERASLIECARAAHP